MTDVRTYDTPVRTFREVIEVEQSSSHSDRTREKVLDAAERLFAQKGFDAVSVREITGQAGVHLSAVNYYFESKKNLYLEVFRARVLPQSQPFQATLKQLEQEEEIDLPVLIRTMVSAFLRGGTGRRSNMVRHGPLFFHELANPSEAFDLLMDELFQPAHDRIKRILARGIKREVEDEQLTFYTMALMALVRHYIHSQAVVQKVFERDFDERFLDQLIDYLSDFMLHGINLEEKA